MKLVGGEKADLRLATGFQGAAEHPWGVHAECRGAEAVHTHDAPISSQRPHLVLDGGVCCILQIGMSVEHPAVDFMSDSGPDEVFAPARG